MVNERALQKRCIDHGLYKEPLVWPFQGNGYFCVRIPRAALRSALG